LIASSTALNMKSTKSKETDSNSFLSSKSFFIQKMTDSALSPDTARGKTFFPDVQADNPSCLFEILINGVMYCFTLKTVSKGYYDVKAQPIPQTENSVTYSVRIQVDEKLLKSNIRQFSNNVPNISMIKNSSNKDENIPRTLLVSITDFLPAWNNADPLDKSNLIDQPSWDFVVLKIKDNVGKGLNNSKMYPRYFIKWMGKEPLSASEQAGKMIATFEVNISEINAEIDNEDPTYNYYTVVDSEKIDPLNISHVKKIIADKKPVSISDAGFDPQNYVGDRVTSETNMEGEKITPFDKIAGHKNLDTKTLHSALNIAPPNTIKANFPPQAFLIPKHLISRHEFDEKVRLLLLYLQDNTEVNIKIKAHTDADGSPGYNEELSYKRALSAIAYLTNNTVWTGIGDKPLALSTDRIKEKDKENIAMGNNLAVAEEEKSGKPKNDEEKVKFRKFTIEYVVP